MNRIAGIDGCKGGWIGVVVDPADPAARLVIHGEDLTDLILANSIDFALVDIPIGLSSGPKPRPVEEAVRAFLKGKSSSVFSVPCRQALEASDYETASRKNKDVLGKGLTPPTWGFMPKITEADRSVRKLGQSRLREGHPEVSFALLQGDSKLARKSSAKGLFQRMTLLAAKGFDLPTLADRLPDDHKAKADDLADAAILCWSAMRVRNDKHRSFPEEIESDDFGLDMAILA